MRWKRRKSMPKCAEVVVQAALGQIESAEREVVVDFGGVSRLDPAALRLLEELAAKARERSVRVAVLGANVELYKVLKLTAVASRFSFN